MSAATASTDIATLLAKEYDRALADASAMASRRCDELLGRAWQSERAGKYDQGAALRERANGCDDIAHRIDQTRVK